MTGESTSPAGAPLLDLERLVAGIRWRRRIWTSLALLGLFAGVLLTVLFPPPPTAVTRVLLGRAEDQQTDQGTLIATDAAICQTSEVAAAALERINVTESPASLLASYQCAGRTTRILEVTVAGASDGDAVRRAQALAEVVVANHITRTEDAVDAEVKPLLDRRARLETTLAAVNNTISTTAPAPAQLDELYSDRANLASQITTLSQRVEDAGIEVPTVIAGTRILDPPRALPLGRLRPGVTNSVVGLVMGLGLGLAVAAVLCVVRDRPVLRRDIAAQLGVSIIAQLPSPPRGPRRLWRRSSQVRESKRVAAALAYVLRNAHTSVSLLEIGCPGATAALAADIARQLTPERKVVIVTDLSSKYLSEAGETADGPARIVDAATLPSDPPSPATGPELHLGVGSVGPGTSWVDLDRLGAETLLVVRAGYATTLALHTVARQLAHAEIFAIGVVLVAPDPRDRSDGTLWDALHTVVRGRHAAAGPARTPGPSRTPKPSRAPGPRPVPASNGRPVLKPFAAPDEEVGIP